MLSPGNSFLNLPKVQEWAIISQQRALQNERMKQMQRLAEYNKKIQFKNQLDHQISQKIKPSRHQQKSDREYLQYILKKAQEQKEKQQKEKMSRILKRKQIQEQNMQALNELRNFRPRSKQPEYALDIGVKSEILQKEREKKAIQQMMDTLDLQVKQKNDEFKGKRSQSRIQRNNSLISEESVNPYRAKNYHQDLKVYQAYQKVLNQKKREQEQFYKKITEEAASKKQFQNEQRRRKELKRKQELTNQMMHTLDTQLKVQNIRKHEEKQMNPEENSFRFIDNMFRQKPAAYDKHKYSEELKNQAQQQNQRKKIHKYMSQEQYKLNMNRLNKIVSGEYINDSYLDRSLDNIGAVPIKNQTVQNYGQNAEFIKNELEKLKRQRKGFYSRMQNSYN